MSMATKATLDYIRANGNGDVRQLALKGTKDPEVDMTYALQQIAGRQTARQKLPSWAAVDGLLYPVHLSMEQCSSEATARYKARLVASWGARSLTDLTGGFGVDFAFMAEGCAAARAASDGEAKGTAAATYVERQEELCAIARHNFRLLGIEAEVVCADGTEHLRHMETVDVIFVDPARRDSHGGRTYGISDCQPDVAGLSELLAGKGRRVMVKLSPMLDWRKAVQDLGPQRVSEVHIVAVANECKELLVVMEDRGDDGADSTSVTCVNIVSGGDEQRFSFNISRNEERLRVGDGTSGMRGYLYEPNASVMKAGCFAALAAAYGVRQIAQNSHLFVSENRCETFPGRVFRIDGMTTLARRNLRNALGGTDRANIAVRNFPLTADQLRQRLRIRDGGDTYIFGTTLADGSHVLLIAHKA